MKPMFKYMLALDWLSFRRGIPLRLLRPKLWKIKDRVTLRCDALEN